VLNTVRKKIKKSPKKYLEKKKLLEDDPVKLASDFFWLFEPMVWF